LTNNLAFKKNRHSNEIWWQKKLHLLLLQAITKDQSYSMLKLLYRCLIGLLLISAMGVAQTPLQLDIEKLKYAQEVEREALAKKDTLQLAEAYYLYGKRYMAAQGYLQAKSYYIKSLRILEKRGISFKLGRLYERLSELEAPQGHLREALKLAHKALFIYNRIKHEKGIASAHQLIGDLFIALNQTYLKGNVSSSLDDSILYYCTIGEKMAYELRDTMSIANVSNILGQLYLSKKNRKGFKYLQTSLSCYKRLKLKTQQVYVLQSIACLHLIFNEHQQALTLIREAESMYKEQGIYEVEINQTFAKFYKEYYQSRKNWKKAFEHLEGVQALTINDFVADREGAVSRLSVEYETEKKEAQLKSQRKELALSNKNQNIQRRFLIAISVLLVGAVLATVAFYRLYRKNQRISRQNAELVHEQNHRVKNNLQLVSSLLTLQSNRLTDAAAKNAVEDTQLRIEVMVILQRKLYDGDHLTSVYLLEFMQELVEIVLQTFSNEHVQVVYEISPTLEVSIDHGLRIGFIVNELATNACKYAFPDHPNPKFKVACSTQGDVFELKAADNGKGFQLPKAADGSKNKSFGMQLIQLQVKQLNGTYRFDTTQGTAFQMQFKV